MESKFIGKVYEGFKVVKCHKKNDYKRVYGKEIKPMAHNCYNYELYNETTRQHLTISGNQLRLLDNGSRTISQMLNTNAVCSRNKQIQAYLKWKRESR